MNPATRNSLVVLIACYVPAVPLGGALLVQEARNPPPLCRGSGGRSGAYAVSLMRGYCSAQTMYRRNDWEAHNAPPHAPGTIGVLEHARDMRDLCECVDGSNTPIRLIDQAMANARAKCAGGKGEPKYGYIFREMKTIAGKPIDWTGDYALCAIPAVYGRTGYRTFIVSTDGTVFGKDQGEGGTFLDDYPADPNAGDWIIAE